MASTNHMTPTSLDQFRTGGFAKSVCITTLSFFVWTFCVSSTAYAVTAEQSEQERHQAAYDAMMETSAEAKLAYRLQKLKDKVTRELPDRMAESQSGLFSRAMQTVGLGGMPIDSEMLEEISSMETGITAAEQEGLKGFDADEQSLLQNKKLSKEAQQLAQQRHLEAKQQVQQRFVELKQKLHALKQANDADGQQAAFDELRTFLEQQQFQKGHTAVDPEHLPFGAPKAEVREPIEDEVALYQLTHEPVYLAANTVTPEMLSGLFGQRNGTQADLDETIDSVQTQAIKDLAAQLNNDPIQIYTWVANNIRFVPSYGSIQGADMTLQTKRGNAMDTASLLIALLRAANTPARYAYGTVDIPIAQAMNWVGGVEVPAAASNLMAQGGIPNKLITTNGVITHLRLEHTWAEAWVDFEPSRGMKNKVGDNWIPMDASYKQYEFTQPTVNLQEQVPFDAQGLADTIEQNTTVNESEGWVQTNPVDPTQLQTQIETALTDYQTQLQTYLQNQQPDATVGDVLGLQTIKVKQIQPLAAGLPYQLIVKKNTFSEIADTLRLKFQYSLYTQFYGEKDQQLLIIEEPTVKLAGKKLALSFKPATQKDADLIASYIPEPDPVTGEIDPNDLPDTLPGYLIKLIPEFSIDNATVSNVTASMTMGTELISEMGFKFPGKSYELSKNLPIAGQYEAIALDLQGVSAQQAEKLKTDLEATKAKLEAENITDLTKHEVLGDILYSTIFSWFAFSNVQSEISSGQLNVIDYRAPSYGLFQTSLVSIYSWGIPKNVMASGFITDIDRSHHLSASKTNDAKSTAQYLLAVGERESSLEHEVPENNLSTDESTAHGISSVRAIAIAFSQGQKVLSINADNLNHSLSMIAFPEYVKDEIRNAVSSGKLVVTHQFLINYNGISAGGFNIIDKELGTGAYKLISGQNGAALANEYFEPVGLFIGYLDFKFQLQDLLKVLGPKVGKTMAKIVGLMGEMITILGLAATATQLTSSCLAAGIPLFIMMAGIVVGVAALTAGPTGIASAAIGYAASILLDQILGAFDPVNYLSKICLGAVK